MEPGDKVRIVAPSSAGTQANLPRITTYVSSLGYTPLLTDNIYSGQEPLYSNTDDFRAADFIQAMLDDSKLIWCIRGGAGSARILDYLDKQLPVNIPQKLFIGYSDATFLHSYLQKRFGWKTVHGTMLEQIVNNGVSPDSIAQLEDLIENPNYQLEMTNVTQLDNGVEMIGGRLEGEIVGGNLTLVETSIGTTWEIGASGKILFIEDVGEAAYRTERSLDHLKQSGLLNPSVKGVIFGDFTGSDSETNLRLVQERFANSINYPVFRLTGIGHGSVNYPLPLNTNSSIVMYNTTQRLCNLTVNNVHL